MYYIGFCSSCGEGVLGVRACAQGDIVAMCDECDAVWVSPALVDAPIFPQQPDLPCSYCQQTLLHVPAHWATLDELTQQENEAWFDLLLGEGEPLGGDLGG